MPTYVFPKNEFIEWLGQIPDDKIIVFTDDISGTVSTSKKKGLQVPLVFSPDVFEDPGVGHIAFGETRVMSFIVTGRTKLSSVGLQALKLNTKTTTSRGKKNM